MAAGAVLAAVAVAWPARAPDDVRRIPIDSAADATDEAVVTVWLTYSSCDELLRIDVAEDARTVRLFALVHDRPSPTCGTSPITRQVVEVRLARPLEARSVVDGDTGGPIRAR